MKKVLHWVALWAGLVSLPSCGPSAEDLKVAVSSIDGVTVTGVARVDGKFIVAFRCANGTKDDYTTPVRSFEESKAEISRALKKYCLESDIDVLKQELEDMKTKPR
jgi:hypothetical protein